MEERSHLWGHPRLGSPWQWLDAVEVSLELTIVACLGNDVGGWLSCGLLEPTPTLAFLFRCLVELGLLLKLLFIVSDGERNWTLSSFSIKMIIVLKIFYYLGLIIRMIMNWTIKERRKQILFKDRKITNKNEERKGREVWGNKDIMASY